MIKNYLKTAFPFYPNRLMKTRYKIGWDGMPFKLISPNGSLLPFQFRLLNTTTTDTISFKIYNYDDTLYADITADISPIIFRFNVQGGYHYAVYSGESIPNLNLPCGWYYAKVFFGSGYVFFSEDFYVPISFSPSNYLQLIWKHSCDTLNIMYATGWLNVMYLEADLHKSVPDIDEEGFTDGEKNFYPTFQKYSDNLRFDELLPDCFVEAWTQMQMHDHIELVRRNDIDRGEIRNVKVSSQFEPNGLLALVEVKCQQDYLGSTTGGCCGNMVILQDSCTPVLTSVQRTGSTTLTLIIYYTNTAAATQMNVQYSDDAGATWHDNFFTLNGGYAYGSCAIDSLDLTKDYLVRAINTDGCAGYMSNVMTSNACAPSNITAYFSSNNNGTQTLQFYFTPATGVATITVSYSANNGLTWTVYGAMNNANGAFITIPLGVYRLRFETTGGCISTTYLDGVGTV